MENGMKRNRKKNPERKFNIILEQSGRKEKKCIAKWVRERGRRKKKDILGEKSMRVEHVVLSETTYQWTDI
jgi:hypothetical protein